MHHPFYNRYTDKTQVFSFFKDDDITRRALHVQLVSRIARNIGRLLGLDLDLIEAIALGHDIGHTPFGHAGERLIGDIYTRRTGRFFNHNVHSVRVLDKIFNLNISLDTLDGILCHNGELELQEYRPDKLSGFDEFDKKVEGCYTDKENVKKLIPSTLEGCVVRVSDIIAYIGKDRQDAQRVGVGAVYAGSENAHMINNFVVNIVENSFGKDYIKMDKEYFDALKKAKYDNYEKIYLADSVNEQYNTCLKPMFELLYEKLLSQIGDKDSLIHRHHIDYVNTRRGYYQSATDYTEENSPDDIVTDYIASMTDDYFIDICAHLIPDAPTVNYTGYFDK
jgi:dGTPase